MNQLANNSNGALAPLKGRGFEEPMKKEDLMIPRVNLMQAMSPQVVDGDMQPGMIVNSLTVSQLPEFVIPIYKFTTWIKWNPRDKNDPAFNKDLEPGAMIWKITDPMDPRTQEGEFGADGEKPTANKIFNFLCYFPGEVMPIFLSFSKTSFKAGKKLLSLARFAGGDMFARKYKLTAKKEVGTSGTYFVFDIAPAGEATPEDFKIAEDYYNMFKIDKTAYKIHEEDKDENS